MKLIKDDPITALLCIFAMVCGVAAIVCSIIGLVVDS